ncbi:MAG: AraC family transcriptional regulator [Clostridiales bacterium]|nr:AraC family transcriptional regulator [Clostridiales bacterium]
MLQNNTLSDKNELPSENQLVYIARSLDDKGCLKSIHKNNLIEIAYIISGTGRYMAGKNNYEVSKGDLFIIDYDIPCGFSDYETLDIYTCAFRPEFISTWLFLDKQFKDTAMFFLFKSLFPETYKPDVDLKLGGIGFLKIKDIFDRMYDEYKNREGGYIDLIRTYLIELIINIFRYVEHGNKRFCLSNSYKLVNKAIKYMNENSSSKITLEDMAAKSFLIKNYLVSHFKEVTGIDFYYYIQKLRVEEACRLLTETNMKILDIALQVGFEDEKSFYKIFKKIKGIAPGKYRKK